MRKLMTAFEDSLIQEKKDSLSAWVSNPELILERTNKSKEWYKSHDSATLDLI